ncbi:MAG TPA: ABC transporter ATP-binding protein [Candidatus Omnitrophota bacterium]|jgi:ABC-2 type transport system ATP-binding protein|nr:ABC transporter ATP-binding protein [Candidatus Omnitrophota bacterium]
MKTVIETRSLTKKFGAKTILAQIDLDVPAGSIYAYLGPNGAGKTTTIKTMVNILRPTRGTVKILGVDSTALDAKEFRQIGYVSENQVLPEGMTANALFDYCRPMYPQWDEGFCQSLTRQFDLPCDEPIEKLSRGMKMKAALIASLAYRPKLLILDEPFSGLDPVARKDLMDGIMELTGTEEWTIFISSHDIEEVEHLADWVGFLHKGQLKLSETTESLQARFKRINITLKNPLESEVPFPANWLLPQQEGRFLCFVDNSFQPGESEKQYRKGLPAVSTIEIQGMSLKEIFLIQARQLKMLNI